MEMDILNCNMSTFCPGVNISGHINNSLLICDEDKNSFFFSGNTDNISFLPHNISRVCNCSQWDVDIDQAYPIAVIRIITSIISIIGSASIILSVLLSGRLNKAEVHPLFILSVADFILSILWMIGGVVWLNPGEGGWAMEGSDPHTGMCYVLGMATSMAGMVTFLLTFVYSMNALFRVVEVYRNRGKVLNEKDGRKKVRHFFIVTGYIISWVLPLLILVPTMEVLVGIESTNQGCWCVPDFFNLRPDDGLETGQSHFNKYALIHASVLGGSFLFTTTAIIVFYIVTLLLARQVLRQQDEIHHDENRSRKMIKSIFLRLTAYIIVFFISGLPIFAASIDVWREKERLHLNEIEDKLILYVHAIFAPLQGILNAFVYGWTRKDFRRAVNCRERMSSVTGDRRSYESLQIKSGRSNESRFNSSILNRNLHT